MIERATLGVVPYGLRVRKAWRKALALAPKRRGALLRLTDGQGHEGWGEVAPLRSVHGPGRSNWVLGEILQPLYTRMPELDAWARAETWTEACERLSTEQAISPALRFGLEMAWLHLAATRSGLRPCDLLGARCAEIPDVPINHLVVATPQRVLAWLDDTPLASVRELKIKVGRGTAAAERKALRELLDALPPHIPLRLDANRAWHLDEACERLRDLPLERFQHIEEPVADPGALPAFHQATGLRVALDETLREAEGTDAHGPHVEAWIVKPSAHGIADTLALAARAASLGVRVVISSCLETRLGLGALAHLAAATARTEDVGCAGLATELMFRGPRPISEALVVDGAVPLGRTPHAPDLAWLAGTDVARGALTRVTARVKRSHALRRLPAPDAPGAVLGIRERTAADAQRMADHALALGWVPLLGNPRRPDDEAAWTQAGACATWTHGVFATRAGTTHLAEDIAALTATSGSSGEAKVLGHTWGAVFHMCRASAEALGLGPDDTWLALLGPHHVGGRAIAWRMAWAGGRVAYPQAGESAVAALARVRPSVVSLVPALLAQALDHEDACAALRRARVVLLGGAATPEHLRQRALDAGVPLVVSYGATETYAFVAATGTDVLVRQANSAGCAIRGVALCVDDNGTLHVASPTLFAGTLGSGAWTARSHASSAWCTGDRAQLIDTSLFVHGRTDRCFQSGGEKIQPERIEQALLALPGVRRACVVDRDDATWGSRPVAFVETTEAWDRTATVAALRGVLANYEVPDAFFALPPTGSEEEKASYARLRQRLAQDATAFPPL